jgi:hypothetical protein
MTKGNATLLKATQHGKSQQGNMEKARQHGKSIATWKKHRKMTKATQLVTRLHKEHQERSTKMGEHEKATCMDA